MSWAALNIPTTDKWWDKWVRQVLPSSTLLVWLVYIQLITLVQLNSRSTQLITLDFFLFLFYFTPRSWQPCLWCVWSCLCFSPWFAASPLLLDHHPESAGGAVTTQSRQQLQPSIRCLRFALSSTWPSLKVAHLVVLSEYCSVKVSWSFCLIFSVLPLQLVLSFKGITESQQEACLSVFNHVLFVKTKFSQNHYGQRKVLFCSGYLGHMALSMEFHSLSFLGRNLFFLRPSQTSL